MYGFIGFDEHRFHRQWHDSDLYILTTAAQILSRAIENKIYERELVENKNLLESIFGSVQDAIITVALQSGAKAIHPATGSSRRTLTSPASARSAASSSSARTRT